MTSLDLLYIKTICLKYKVDLEKLQGLAEAYLAMFEEVLENNTEVPDILYRTYTDLEATSNEIRVLTHLLKTLYGLPITMVLQHGSVVLETNMVAPLPSI